MALLQISEPGHSPDPHQRRIAVGIDLGTTHSLVAAVRSGAAECLPDGEGRVILPSVVRYLENGGGGRGAGCPCRGWGPTGRRGGGRGVRPRKRRKPKTPRTRSRRSSASWAG